ncbi:unnamed protein product [Larinioides sclopetarius]|uniref:Uncharacterized protein n=1 Tax=Larinioides sclopetarius TaxID=280406 RepID=A0AAV1ZIJ5_9ARAC
MLDEDMSFLDYKAINCGRQDCAILHLGVFLLFVPSGSSVDTATICNHKDAAAQNNHKQMYALFEIITHCLVKNLLVWNAFQWVLCESRHLLGIGTRLTVNSDGEFVHTYSAWTKGEMSGYSDTQNDDFQRPRIPLFVPIFFVLFGFFFFLSCICICLTCKRRQRRLWANIEANPSRPAFEIYPPIPRQEIGTPPVINDVPPNYRTVVEPNTRTANHTDSLNHYPPVIRQEVRTPIVINDVPPNYRAVVEPNPTAPNYGDSINHYPAVTRGNVPETPPPAYTTVAPFK